MLLYNVVNILPLFNLPIFIIYDYEWTRLLCGHNPYDSGR